MILCSTMMSMHQKYWNSVRRLLSLIRWFLIFESVFRAVRQNCPLSEKKITKINDIFTECVFNQQHARCDCMLWNTRFFWRFRMTINLWSAVFSPKIHKLRNVIILVIDQNQDIWNIFWKIGSRVLGEALTCAENYNPEKYGRKLMAEKFIRS